MGGHVLPDYDYEETEGRKGKEPVQVNERPHQKVHEREGNQAGRIIKRLVTAKKSLIKLTTTTLSVLYSYTGIGESLCAGRNPCAFFFCLDSPCKKKSN